MNDTQIISKLLHRALDHLRPLLGPDPMNQSKDCPAGKAFFEIACALFRLNLVKDGDDLKYLSSETNTFV